MSRDHDDPVAAVLDEDRSELSFDPSAEPAAARRRRADRAPSQRRPQKPFDPGIETGYLRRTRSSETPPPELGAAPFDPGLGDEGFDPPQREPHVDRALAESATGALAGLAALAGGLALGTGRILRAGGRVAAIVARGVVELILAAMRILAQAASLLGHFAAAGAARAGRGTAAAGRATTRGARNAARGSARRGASGVRGAAAAAGRSARAAGAGLARAGAALAGSAGRAGSRVGRTGTRVARSTGRAGTGAAGAARRAGAGAAGVAGRTRSGVRSGGSAILRLPIAVLERIYRTAATIVRPAARVVRAIRSRLARGITLSPSAKAGVAIAAITSFVVISGSALGLPLPVIGGPADPPPSSSVQAQELAASQAGIAAVPLGGGTSPAITEGPFHPVIGKVGYGEEGAQFGASRGGRAHEGHDVFAKPGTPLVAVRDGVVVDGGRGGRASAGAGNYVSIYSSLDDRTYVYLHMLKPASVALGDEVQAGEQIGLMGCTGSCFGVHLHFEVHRGRHSFRDPKPALDPLPLLSRWPQAPGS